MPISSAVHEDTLVISILDERLSDESQIKRLADDLTSLLGKSEKTQVVIDFAKVQFMSSAMLGKLVQLHKKCQEFKVRLKLSGISAEILKGFKITGLHKLFDIASDAATARKAFNKRGLFG